MIDQNELAALCRSCGADIQLNEPLAAHTTFRIGGPCAAMVTLPDIEAVKAVTAYLRQHQTPHTLIGHGSNLLVPDEGYAGVVLKLDGVFQEISVSEDGVIRCGAGVPLQKLCKAALDAHLTGLEFAYGIPASVGGAVYMNAGAYNGEISQVLRSVTIMDETGALRSLSADTLDLRYRHSILMSKNWMILHADFELQAGDHDAIQARMQELITRRKEKQPLEYPSAGSTFKRPEGAFAGKLIDECGLRGYTSGGAQVSEKHAGFVINRGNATFADVMAVCQHVQAVVKAQTGYLLEMEPEILRT